jgi:hypothetical protein
MSACPWRPLSALLALLLCALASSAGRPVYTVREYLDVPIVSINVKTRRFSVPMPKNPGVQALSVSPKTWILKDNEEASFADLRVGQRVRVHFIPRGGQALAVEMLRAKGKAGGKP